MKRFFSILTKPKLWLTAFFLWLATLLILSSLSNTLPPSAPTVPHLDKILHFGYFFGGAIIFSTWLLLKYGTQHSFLVRYFLPLIIFGLLGAIDEYRQTHTPGRSGNDPFDWIADILGASSGILIANLFHHRFLKLSSPPTTIPEI